MPHTTPATAKARDGCLLSYRLHAQPGKPRLALIHSLALDGSIWDGVVAALARDMEILVYDCRGHGRSEHRPGAYTQQLFAEDLATLLDHCGWPSAFVAGCSMGGCVAQAFGAAYPSCALGLALVDTSAWWGPTAPQDWRERAEAARKDGLGPMVSIQLGRWFSDSFRQAHPELMDAITRIFLASDLQCYASSCAMLGDTDLRDAARSLRMPVSIIVGEDDPATPVAMSQSLHEMIPRSTLTIIPGARHLTPVEFPHDVATQLRSLVSRA